MKEVVTQEEEEMLKENKVIYCTIRVQYCKLPKRTNVPAIETIWGSQKETVDICGGKWIQVKGLVLEYCTPIISNFVTM